MNIDPQDQLATILKRLSESGASIFDRPYFDTFGTIRSGLVIQMPDEECHLLDEPDLLPSLVALAKRILPQNIECCV